MGHVPRPGATASRGAALPAGSIPSAPLTGESLSSCPRPVTSPHNPRSRSGRTPAARARISPQGPGGRPAIVGATSPRGAATPDHSGSRLGRFPPGLTGSPSARIPLP
ncbi:hypothetical protein NDU88_007679 [Pleurodeles waltl]|uniref:Uncharacterized protein n=1 Tax=Pleurodeles waltl TaxID=8319 RepID=A0AAV7U264_PLEWA|nr:hypothetical protein NDU88_007679 [Pleurodeles waltl]